MSDRTKLNVVPDDAPSITPERGVRAMFGAMFNTADTKLARRLRRGGRIKEAEAAERRIAQQQRAVRKGDRQR